MKGSPKVKAALDELLAAGMGAINTYFVTAGEETIDWLEAQLSLIENLGEANYLAQQLGA